mmetsp:Transcript_77185/g.194105  ORF Transcript_77185/g.194105 Transcript_77185/m.194105 type:complete len:86 (+) Transcript_77185:62-319(+)
MKASYFHLLLAGALASSSGLERPDSCRVYTKMFFAIWSWSFSLKAAKTWFNLVSSPMWWWWTVWLLWSEISACKRSAHNFAVRRT